jgi:undecaprenyl-diphosphatase
MPLLHLIILAVVQGITEFLPISSSGHLILTWEFLAVGAAEGAQPPPSEQLVIDIAVHMGTLLAVCCYFWRDVWQMTAGAVRLATGRRSPGARLAGYVIVATIPVVVVGVLAKDYVTDHLRSLEVIAWATLGFGLLLWLADKIGMLINRLEHLNLGTALFIGVAQVLALIPGTSRSGITMTAARFMGFERSEAARFSMLLAIPTILGAGVLAGYDLYQTGNIALGVDAAIAAALAFVSALVAIAILMLWLRRAGFGPFVVYRILLGLFLLWLVYGESVLRGFSA